MRLRTIVAVVRKDAFDAVRDARIIVSLVIPIVLGLFYNAIFPDTPFAPVTLVYHADDQSIVLERLRAFARPATDLRVTEVATEAEARDLVAKQTVFVALVVPAGFDAAVRQGQTPTVLVIGQDPPGPGELWLTSALDRILRELAGQKPPAALRVDRVQNGAPQTLVFTELGGRRYFVLATVVMLIAMIGLLAVPVMLTEEMERKTIDALLLIMRHADVIAAKLTVGLVYVLLGVPLMLALTRIVPADPVAFVVGAALLSLVLVGLGLLLAGVFGNATRVYTWSGFFVLVIVGPAFATGFPLPVWADALLRATPTAQGMRLLANGVGGKPIFDDAWLSYVVLVIWAVAAFGVLWWQLARREA